MKTKILTITFALYALLARAAAPETSPEIIIGLSPFQPTADRSKQEALLQRFVVADCPNGSRVIVWDAWELKTIFDVQLPKLAYDSPSARARHIAPALAALRQWFVKLDGNQSPAGMKNTSAIKIPEWLQMATTQPSTGGRAIVLLASPFCLVPDEPSFSMIETRYPSDGHLNAGNKSIYSIAEMRGRLANTVIFWAYPSESVWASQYHRERIARWWSLFTAGQGGVLAGFSSDAPQLMLAATRMNHRAIGEFSVNTDDSALVMHAAMQREVPMESQQRNSTPPPEPPLRRVEKSDPPQAPVVLTVPPRPPVALPPPPKIEPPQMAVEESVIAIPMTSEIPTPAVGNIGIAAVWQAERGTDIDLWVGAKPGLPEAYWNRPRVQRVHYFRDIRTSQSANENGQWRAAWEYVEVEHAQIGEPTVWLNVYAAKGPVSGVVRVQFEGRVVDRPFKFNVTRGNSGRDSNLTVRARSPYWQQVNLADFFPAASN